MLTLSPKPEAAAHWTDKDLYQLAEKLRTELDQGRQCRPQLHLGRRARRDPRRTRSGEARALRRDAAAARRPRCSGANRSFLAGTVRDAGASAGGGRPDAVRRPRYRPAAAHHARRPAGLCARRGQGRRSAPAPVEQRVWTSRRRQGGLGHARPAVTPRASPSAPAPTRWWSPRRSSTRVDALKGALIPSDIRVEVTRDYGATANDKANELLFHLASPRSRSWC